MAHVSAIGNAMEQHLPMFVIMMYVHVDQDISKLAGSATQVKQVEFIMISIISWLTGKYSTNTKAVHIYFGNCS